MAGGSNGYRAALVRRQLTPGLISSLPGTAGLPPFISFSTSYPEQPNAADPIIKTARFWVRGEGAIGRVAPNMRVQRTRSSPSALARR
jgi:hypothetical protein